MHKDNKFEIISFYEFINLSNIEQLKFIFFKFLKQKNFRGTIIIANEGLNGTISCNNGKADEFYSFSEEVLKKKIKFKKQYHSSHPFLRLKIKVKEEIVKMGEKNIFPIKNTGNYLSPSEWDEFISDPNVINIDTRNIYESEIGTFKNSLLTNTKNFTQFPDWFKKNKKKIKEKKIAMFCTGGVRCEKASSYLIKNGFKNVFQLNGGIISYLEQTKNKNKKWVGECFVFDERVAVKDNLSKGQYDQCFACRAAISEKDKKSNSYKKGVFCPKCKNQTSLDKKKGFEERNKQIFLAKKKGITHLGS